jgi:hypothetical protein
VETARDLVGRVVELSARVEGGEYDFGGRAFFGGVNVDRNSAAVVGDGDTAVLMDRDRDLFAESAHGFVDGIVHRLVDEVVEPIGTGGPNVHRRAFSDWIEALEDLDRTRVVAQGRTIPVTAFQGAVGSSALAMGFVERCVRRKVLNG